eukprot:g23512.t1
MSVDSESQPAPAAAQPQPQQEQQVVQAQDTEEQKAALNSSSSPQARPVRLSTSFFSASPALSEQKDGDVEVAIARASPPSSVLRKRELSPAQQQAQKADSSTPMTGLSDSIAENPEHGPAQKRRRVQDSHTTPTQTQKEEEFPSPVASGTPSVASGANDSLVQTPPAGFRTLDEAMAHGGPPIEDFVHGMGISSLLESPSLNHRTRDSSFSEVGRAESRNGKGSLEYSVEQMAIDELELSDYTEGCLEFVSFTDEMRSTVKAMQRWLKQFYFKSAVYRQFVECKTIEASASTVHPIRKKDGTMATTQTERLDTVTRYRAKLGAPLQNPSFDETFRTTIEARMAKHLRDSVAQAEIDLDGEFTLEELEECFEQAQFGKACGSDETRNEMFKCGGATMRQLLLRVFNFLRDIETTPDDWGMGTLVNLYKDGDPADLGNYRGIALMSCLGKLYLSLWARRLSGFMEGKLSEEQGGFRPNRSTTDQIISLHEALVRRKLTRRSTHMFFVDFRKAFDTVGKMAYGNDCGRAEFVDGPGASFVMHTEEFACESS